MVWHVAVAILKPFVVIWAALNVVDDLALIMKLGRLGAAIIPRPGKNRALRQSNGELCGLCDDVMGGLLRGSAGLSVMPCGALCLGVHKCMDMCERLKTVSAETTEFPCVAAGYCEATGMEVADPECHPGPLFSCQPRQYCRRRRQGLKLLCDLRPGIGRWVGMKNAAGKHIVALAVGLVSQPHCGEPNAGPYCIAKPVGLGAVAEAVGIFVALVFGGYKSVLAIESPGGSDDRQWLTFWLIFAVLVYVERFFARVILSSVPFYYEIKLALLVWLVWRSGAERVYRILRRSVVGRKLLLSDERASVRALALMKATGKTVVEEQLALLGKSAKDIERKPSTPNWEYDEEEYSAVTDAARQLYQISKYLLSPEGAKAVQDSTDITEEDAGLLAERAAEIVSFQPRFLRVRVRGVVGSLPAMDRNGLADPYVVLQLRPHQGGAYPPGGVRSSIRYKTLRPTWNQELELPLLGGSLDPDGYYRSNGVAKTTGLFVSVRDADVGQWSITYYFFCIAMVLSVVAAIFARIRGISDSVTETQRLGILVVAGLVFAGFVFSYLQAVVIRTDDNIIGDCKMPIEMLLDQRAHHFRLTLRKPASTKGENNVAANATKVVGALGVLRVSLMLSEH